MPNTKTNAAVIIIIVIILAVLGFFYFRRPPAQKTIVIQPTVPVPANVQPAPSLSIKLPRQDIPDSQLPDNFPKNIPLEAGAPIIQNYNVKFGATEVSGRAFQTAKTLDQNFKLYSDYFSSNGWTITTSQNQAALKKLVASKGSVQLEVDMSQDSSSGANVVTITATVNGQKP